MQVSALHACPGGRCGSGVFWLTVPLGPCALAVAMGKKTGVEAYPAYLEEKDWVVH